MSRTVTGLVFVTVRRGGAGRAAPPASPRRAATPQPLSSTREGPALRVGPPGSESFVGLLANGEGAFGVAVAASGAFLAFTRGMASRADVWFSGDCYRGRLPVAVTRPDRAPVLTAAAPADELFRRQDADGVLGASALPGNIACAVRRTAAGRFLSAGTVPYRVDLFPILGLCPHSHPAPTARRQQ
jgi:hypothetical protein